MQSRLDTVTLEVIRHRLDSIADEMEMALLKSAFSTIVKEGQDTSAAIFDAQGRTIAQAVAIPIHLGCLIPSVKKILETFPPSQMREGDVYLMNDPYAGGTHLNDFTMVVPILRQGELMALSCVMTHQQDIGAITPGVSTSATSIYQEGLNLPPLKFYDAGKLNESILEIIKRNVRVPDIVMGDMRAQIAAGNVGKLRLLELFDEYGKDVVLAAMQQLLDDAEALTRQELEKIPDGSYTFADYMDNDGVDMDRRIKIQVTVTIRGSEFIADFSGSSHQVRGPFNCVPSTTLSAVCYVLRCLTGASIPNNSGCFRPITLNLPEGSIVNPLPPAAVGSRAQTVERIVDALMGALVKVAPQRLRASSNGFGLVLFFGGTDPLTGKEYVTTEFIMGGMGGRPTKDGIDSFSTDTNNLRNIPVEAQEMNYPIRVWKRALRNWSGGAGEYRGGLGEEEVFEMLSGRASVTYRGERHYTNLWGLFGGHSTPNNRGFVLRRTGEREELPSKRDLLLSEGDQLHVFVTGGGGYGDPLKRKPEIVLRDVLDRRVSLETATEDYGVVIDEELMTVDAEKTSQVRKEQERLRGPITWTYDRGPELGRE